MMAIVAIEFVLHFFRPYGADMEARIWRPPLDETALANRYTTDPLLGFRPVLGTNGYSEFGTILNSYPFEKRPGITRLLFVGDSVTARGHLLRALEEICGDASVEFWNAGVESFNTVQEVMYYERYNAALNPDHVILSFHNNDFQTTPVAFRRADGGITLYTPHMARSKVNPWLLRHSELYRRWLARAWSLEEKQMSVVQDVEGSLLRLRDALSSRNIRFSVVLLPLMKPLASWSPQEMCSRRDALAIFSRLHLRVFDLMPTLDEAAKDGVDLSDVQGDTWHPSMEMSRCFARQLMNEGLMVCADGGPAP